MTRRILDVLGFLCVLGLLGACGALVLMKQPLHVSIAGETSAHKARRHNPGGAVQA